MSTWQYGKDGKPTHGDYCPNADYACVCGLFDMMFLAMEAIETGLRALGGQSQ